MVWLLGTVSADMMPREALLWASVNHESALCAYVLFKLHVVDIGIEVCADLNKSESREMSFCSQCKLRAHHSDARHITCA
jgi:hypothetical protein